ncbi:MAG: OmpH family outer membrane protein [Gammaproteobacteria bacterium]
MKQLPLVFALAIFVLSHLTAVSAAEVKVGYVDAARLLQDAPQAQVATQRLKEEFAPREDEMIAIQNELKQLEERLDRDGAIMSEAERKRIGLDILARKRELRRLQEDFREDINLRRNDAIGSLQQLIKKAIEDVGREGKYDLIFYEGIAYANPALDITDVVLEGLKKLDVQSGKKQ